MYYCSRKVGAESFKVKVLIGGLQFDFISFKHFFLFQIVV